MTAQPLLLRPHRYSFIVLYGLDVDSITKLDLRKAGIDGFKMKSPKFKKLLNEVVNIQHLLKDELKLTTTFHADEISYVFFAKSNETLEMLYRFLIILTPSKITPWFSFDAEFHSYKDRGKTIEEYRADSVSYHSIGKLYSALEVNDILSFYTSDYKRINNLLNKFFTLRSPDFYKRLLNLYVTAYNEERDYFKFLMLFMIVESLIVDDENTGVVYKIRRLCAVLVGDSIDMSDLIFQKIAKAYAVRSTFVHSAKNTVHEGRYLPFLQSIVCELLITLMLIEPKDDKIFALTNRLGFGVKSSLIKDKGLRGYQVLMNNRMHIHRNLKVAAVQATKKP